MSVTDTAVARFQQEYSCSQAVFSALAEPRGVEREMALRISAGFGGGLARSARTCGCVAGAAMALGLAQHSVRPEDNKKGRETTYQRIQRFLGAFAERNGSTVCLDLLGCDISTAEGLAHARQAGLFQSRCVNLVRDAVELAEVILVEAER